MERSSRILGSVSLLPVLGGCREAYSVLAPNSDHAQHVLNLTWVLFAGGTVIFIAVLAATALSLTGFESVRGWLRSERFIVLAGLAFPAVVLSALLVYGALVTNQGHSKTASAAPLEIAVVGEQWWWRVIYEQGTPNEFETANEIHIPVGQPVKLTLTSADVIHSFWVPALAGKIDTIPGRTTVLSLSANKPGVFRGQCAEYCGGAHARMGLFVVSHNSADFATWLDLERKPARKADSQSLQNGERSFHARGCGGCHQIRGSVAQGRIGPDLTHIGSRQSIAAAVLPNTTEAIKRWIKENQNIKPKNHMLAFDVLPPNELHDIAVYLKSLK